MTIQRRVVLAWAGIGLLLLLMTVLFSLRLAPTVIEQGRDSGIYAYAGLVIRQGGVLYEDIWDNKLPGIFYLNALIFWVFGISRWSLWAAELLFVWAGGLLVFWLVSRAYRQRWLAWGGALIFILLARHPDLVWDTNFTEPYSLLFQVLCFVTGYQLLRSQSGRWALALGLSASLALLIKQSTVGVALAFIPAVLISRHPITRSAQRGRLLALIIAGGLIGLGIPALYFGARGLLPTMIDAGFVAPAALHHWISARPVPFLDTVEQTLNDNLVRDVFGPLAVPLLLGAGVGVWRAVGRRTAARPAAEDDPAAPDPVLGLWAGLTLLIDLLIANPTYRAYEHYYITLFPAATLLLVGFLWGAWSLLRPRSLWGARLILAALVIYVGLGVGKRPVENSYNRLSDLDWKLNGPQREEPPTPYVIAHTAPGDRVLVWGAWSAVNFQSRRLSPTRYHYGYGLIVPDDETQARIEQAVRDLEAHPPALIVDSTMIDGRRVPPLDPAHREAWWNSGGRRDVADLQPIFDFVAAHCTISEEIGKITIFTCESEP